MKKPLPVLLLPGMDGTGELFHAFVMAAPKQFEPIVVPCPDSGSYEELEKTVRAHIPPEGRFAIVAESFSGPLGVRVATADAERILGLVLCNTFAARPALKIFALLPWKAIFALPRPMFVIRWRLLGRFATPDLLRQIRSILNKTPAHVLAARMRSVLRCDETIKARSLRCPVLYLRGTEDRVIWDRVVSATLRCLPNAARHDLVAPHLLLQTSPQAAWSAIETFLTSNRLANSA